MITINITIEAELNAKLDETGTFLKEDSQKKLDDLMVDLEKRLIAVGLANAVIDYDFYDDDDYEDDTDILNEGFTVTEVKRNEGIGWNTEEGDTGEVEEEGRKYKKGV